jgi:hypothetical protein
MAKNTLTILEENYDLVEALAAAHDVEITVVEEYDDQLELEVTGVRITEFVTACNAL